MKFGRKIFTILKHADSKKRVALFLSGVTFFSLSIALVFVCQKEIQRQSMNVQVKKLIVQKESVLTGGVATDLSKVATNLVSNQTNEILPEYQSIYEENQDFIGWISIENTEINDPVMQTPSDENYYLTRGFDKKKNENGCLILDTDSQNGVGVKGNYNTAPSTNLIIHGHNMKSGAMFGELDLYKDKEYEANHSAISFDTLYEKRKYKLIAVFYSKVYEKTEDVFKYYQFFNATTEEEFQEFYSNIKTLSLYDTGETAQFGDEFLTLSTCAYQTENGRFVVIAKRIQ